MLTTSIMTKRKRSEHYVNNKEFLAALIAYRDSVELAQIRGEPKPRITNYLGDCFLKIATHLSFKPNFVNYMFKDDMICDGIENCVQYIHNFDPKTTPGHSKSAASAFVCCESIELPIAKHSSGLLNPDVT